MHPASIGAVLLLLLNDHVLKSVVPSAFTGKLSDFAGLFFFPFLLALPVAVLAAFFRRISTRATGILAFAITAVWFAAAKATVAGNSIMVDFISTLSGGQAVIVHDPTDLIALLALLPAWYLWQRQEQRVDAPFELRFALPVILLASCAVMATSPSRHTWEPGVAELIVADGKIYAVIGLRSSAYTTTDNGYTWVAAKLSDIPVEPGDSLRKRQERASMQLSNANNRYEDYRRRQIEINQQGQRLKDSLGHVPSEYHQMELALTDSVALYQGIRDPAVSAMNMADSAIRNAGTEPVMYNEDSIIVTRTITDAGPLYRSKLGSTRIERSDDRGGSWYVDWEIPDGRDAYIWRQLKDESRFRQIGVRDMEFLPGADGVLVAALGSGGVMVRDQDGSWSQHQIGDLELVTPSARSFDEIISMLKLEWFALFALALIAGVVLNAAGWRTIPTSDDKSIEKFRPRTIPRIIILVVGIVLATWFTLTTNPIFGLLVPLVFFLPLALIFAGKILFDWSRMRHAAGGKMYIAQVIRICRYATLAALVLPTVCMIFWTLGIVISYQSAAIGVAVLWIGAVIGGIVMIEKVKNSVEESGSV